MVSRYSPSRADSDPFTDHQPDSEISEVVDGSYGSHLPRRNAAEIPLHPQRLCGRERRHSDCIDGRNPMRDRQSQLVIHIAIPGQGVQFLLIGGQTEMSRIKSLLSDRLDHLR